MDPKRILLVSLTNIGDVVLTTPVLEVLHQRWPKAEISFLVGETAASLFEVDPRVSEVIAYNKWAPFKSKLDLIARLRENYFDLIVDLKHSLLPWLVGAWHHTGWYRKRREGVHRIESHLDLVRAFGLPAVDLPVRLHVDSSDETQVKQWLADQPPNLPLVAMVPGARSHLKRWSSKGFAEVADTLMEQNGVQVVMIGDASDQPAAREVMDQMRQQPMNLVGKTSLRQLAALFHRMKLVITNDSACLHVATAASVPVVALFGPTDPVKYGPRGDQDTVCRLSLICSPCEQALCPYGHECMQWLKPDDVISAARKVLAP